MFTSDGGGHHRDALLGLGHRGSLELPPVLIFGLATVAMAALAVRMFRASSQTSWRLAKARGPRSWSARDTPSTTSSMAAGVRCEISSSRPRFGGRVALSAR
jgi:hypothetical protein